MEDGCIDEDDEGDDVGADGKAKFSNMVGNG